MFSKLKSLFSVTNSAPPETTESMPSVDYKGYQITPEPQSEGGQYRISGWIRKEDKAHHFIRADILSSQQACADEMIRKARVLIDQRGINIFN